MKRTKKALVAILLTAVIIGSTTTAHAGEVAGTTATGHVKLTPYEVPSPTTSYWNDICYWAYQASIAIS